MISFDKKVFRKYEDDLLNVLQNLIVEYEKEGKIVTNLFNQKFNLNTNGLFKAYYSMIREDIGYREYLKKVALDEKINNYKLKIENRFYEYIRVLDFIKDFLQNNMKDMVKRNTLRENLRYIDKLNQKILKLIVFNLNSEFNQYYLTLEELKKISHDIYNKISIQLHVLYQEHNFIREIDYSILKKIELTELKKGDIILNDEYTKYKDSFVRKQIKFWLKSTILHSMLYVSYENKNHIVYEAPGTNRKKTYIGIFKIEPGTKYVVLKGRFFLDGDKLNSEVVLQLDKKFGFIKIIGIALEYTLNKLYKNWVPKLTTGKNIYFGNGLFCSEAIAIIYNNLKLNISNNEDFGMVSPVDIFNSYNLDIVGYFEGKNE